MRRQIPRFLKCPHLFFSLSNLRHLPLYKPVSVLIFFNQNRGFLCHSQLCSFRINCIFFGILMATVEVVSVTNVLPEDTTEAISLKTDQEKITQQVVETPTPASEHTKEEEAAVTKAPEPAAPEGKPSDEVETKDVVEEEAKVEAATVTEEETKREEAETEVVEENKENADPAEVQAPAAAEPETGIQKEDVVKEEKATEPEAKDKDNKEAPAEQSEEKVDTEASDEKKEEEVIAAEKSEEVVDVPREKSE